MTEKKFDIILVGATGLVGRYGVRQFHKLTSTKNLKLTWGVAGRSELKIQEVLQQIYRETNDERIRQTPIFVADMKDPLSLENMVKNTKVLLNFCGPLRRHGELIIKTCIKFKTHYLDLSAEPNFIEKIQLEYDEKARNAGIYVSNSCGYDSLAYEMGIVFLQRSFKGSLNSVETYLRYGADRFGIPGPDYNTSTWNSIIDLLGNTKELKDIRKRRNDNWPALKPRLKRRLLPFKPEYEDGWAVISPSADLSVMQRTQQHMFREEHVRPIQIESYFMFINIFDVIFFVISGLILLVFSKFQWGRDLLIKNPSLFTGGLFTTEEPTEEKLDSLWCSLTMVGKGSTDQFDSQKDRSDAEIVARIKGNNTGYKLTSLCLVLAGIVLITESHNLPKRKGVLTPGILFSNTTIIEQLDQNGLKFELLVEPGDKKK